MAARRLFAAAAVAVLLHGGVVGASQREDMYCGAMNCYERLGLTQDADARAVTSAYRQLAREVCPALLRLVVVPVCQAYSCVCRCIHRDVSVGGAVSGCVPRSR
jgi:hypothetical protein